MAEFDQRSPINLKDFVRYQSGEMSFPEQHAFEKRLLSDPAFAEAYEGFTLLNPTSAQADKLHAELADKLTARTASNGSRKTSLWTYASAASVIITAGILWIVLAKDKVVEKVSKVPAPIEQPVIKPAEPLPDANVNAAPIATAPELPRKKQRPVRTQPEQLAPEPLVAAAPLLDENVKADSDFVKARVAVSEPVPSAFAAPPSSIQWLGRAAPAKMSRSTSRLVSDGALSEQSDVLSTDKPQPKAGWQQYLSYMQQNTPAYEGSETVIVSFTVKADGTLTALKATGKVSLQSAAIEVVRKGPAWTPAKQNGSPVDATAEVAIYFHAAK
ncbi:energy transducer TonB [Dyadobacter sp.]|uniref:energy transducer TonB n=1 Tax=Dyadobacter sp. TaxID=1914288 RepID=UPI003F708A58